MGKSRAYTLKWVAGLAVLITVSAVGACASAQTASKSQRTSSLTSTPVSPTPVSPTPVSPSLDLVAATDSAAYPPFFGDEGNTYWADFIGDFHLCTKSVSPESQILLRLGPSRDAPILAEVNEETCGIRPIGAWLDGWAPVLVDAFNTSVQDGSLMVGYVRSEFVRPATEQGLTPWFEPNLIDPQWCVVEGLTPVPLRIAPIDDAPSVGTIESGECNIFLATEPGSTGAWVRVTVDFDARGAGWMELDQIVSTEQFVDFGEEPLVVVRFAFQDNDGEFLQIQNFKVYDADGLVVGAPDSEGVLKIPASLDPFALNLRGWNNGRHCVLAGPVQTQIDEVYVAVVAYGGCT